MKTTLVTFVKALIDAWGEEKPARLAAALAYYAMFSLAPVFFVSLTIAGFFMDEAATADQVFQQLEGTLGTEVAQFIHDSVIGVSESASGSTRLTTLIGFLALLYASTGLFANLKLALNTIWHADPASGSGILFFIKTRLLAFLMVIGIGLLLVLVTFASTVFAILDSFFDMPGSALVGNFGLLFGVSVLAFGLMYKILPDVKVLWRDVWVGAAVTALLFSICRLLIGFYLVNSDVGSAFGAAGALAVLLVAVYYFAQIFLFGAVFTKVYSNTFGSRKILPVAGPEALRPAEESALGQDATREEET